MMHDDAFLDSVAVLALGALPEAEALGVAAHVATCAACRREYDELRGAAALVGYAGESAPGSIDELAAKRMKSAVMRVVRATDGVSPIPAASAPAFAATPARRTGAWLPYAAAAAAIVAFLVSTSNNAGLRSQNDRDRQRIADLESRAAAQSAAANVERTRIAALFAPGSKSFTVPGGDVVTSGGRVYFALRALPAPPPGKVYQAWTLARGAKAVAPSVTFVPGSEPVTVIELPEHANGLVAVALSVEPAGGSKAPTSKPAFIRPLS